MPRPKRTARHLERIEICAAPAPSSGAVGKCDRGRWAGEDPTQGHLLASCGFENGEAASIESHGCELDLGIQPCPTAQRRRPAGIEFDDVVLADVCQLRIARIEPVDAPATDGALLKGLRLQQSSELDAGGAQALPQGAGGYRVDCVVCIQDQAIELARCSLRNVAIAQVGSDALGVALEGIAIATAARRPDQDGVALLERVAGNFAGGRELFDDAVPLDPGADGNT